MPDYKKMYLTIYKASEEALDLLVTAQRECEKLYLAQCDPDAKPEEEET